MEAEKPKRRIASLVYKTATMERGYVELRSSTSSECVRAQAEGVCTMCLYREQPLLRSSAVIVGSACSTILTEEGTRTHGDSQGL